MKSGKNGSDEGRGEVMMEEEEEKEVMKEEGK